MFFMLLDIPAYVSGRIRSAWIGSLVNLLLGLQQLGSDRQRKKMGNVVAIMDLDGFAVNRNFLCKELGLIPIGNEGQSHLFDLEIC